MNNIYDKRITKNVPIYLYRFCVKMYKIQNAIGLLTFPLGFFLFGESLLSLSLSTTTSQKL